MLEKIAMIIGSRRQPGTVPWPAWNEICKKIIFRRGFLGAVSNRLNS